MEVLDAPHLVLAHVGGHDGVLGTHLLEGAQDLVGGEDVALRRGLGAVGEDEFLPRRVLVAGDAVVDHLEDLPGVSDDVVVGLDVLVDLGPVDVDMYDLGLLGEAGGVGGHPVGEPAAHGDEQVAVVAGHVGAAGAVHAQHAGGEGVGAGEAAAAHDGDGHRGVQLFGQGAELLMGPAADHAAAADEHGLLRMGDELHQLVHVVAVGGGGRQVPARPLPQVGQPAVELVLLLGEGLVVDHHVQAGDVFQKVDEHRAGPAHGGHGEGLPDDVGDVVGVPDQVGGLGDGHGDAGDVHLLEGVLTQGALGDVAGEEDHRGGVHVGGGDAGGQVGGAGAGGGEAHPHPAGGPGVAVGGVGGALLVGGQDVADLVLIAVELVIYI